MIKGRESAARADIGFVDWPTLDHFGTSRDNGKCAKQLRMKFETYQAAAHLIDQ